MNTPMYNLAVILFLVSLFNDQKVVPLNTELSLNGTSCPSNVTLRELKLGIIVAVARLSEGLSVTVTCADIPFPVTFMGKAGDAFLVCFHFQSGRSAFHCDTTHAVGTAA